ncbi:phage major capsid protein [Bradyrhizobium sp. Leo170]|uniref:phage major capsid protein n=1 Tax=Bradyrhizobium sp. Leo170 TaxID=1571199 RepID=UPI0010CF3583|nr:phage major capsid protein [Bradyrhizobium sp. Leo170]TAI65696.1 hypothetical protein CWO89_12200 [Bradyrhizobium sp. Leo170]
MNARPLPLVPEDVDQATRSRAAVAALARACIASARATINPATNETTILQRHFRRDLIAKAIVTRSPVSPTETGGVLSHQIVADIIAALSPASAGAAIIAAGLRLRFDGAAAISVPSINADPALAQFVGEGRAIPVVSGLVQPPVLLRPRKLASIMVMTREQIESSNAEVLFTDALLRSTGLALDTVLLGSNPDDGINPPGLRAGIAALTASSNPDAVEAMMEDIETLAKAVLQITAAPPILVMAPARALVAELRAPHGLEPLTVLGSAALAADEVVAIAPVAVASADGDIPEVESNGQAEVNFETDAQPIVDESGKVAVPVASLFQSDRVGIRVKHPIDWVLRDARGVAWLKATGW